MTFQFKYDAVVRTPNPMVTINPLKRGSQKTVTLQDRVETLNKNASWKKTIKAWKNFDLELDESRLPKVSMEVLGSLLIDEDIQRALDEKHCANDIAMPGKFDPALLQTIQCIKTSQGEFISIDGQHTVASVAALIDAGLVKSCEDWKLFKFPFQYIETDSLSYARRAFGILNGKGKKKQSAYQQLRNSIYIVRIDGDRSDDDDVEVEEKVSVAERFECFPVEESSTLLKYPGTFSNIATFKTLKLKEIEMACSWHNNYFHYENIHVSLFFIFRDMNRDFHSAKLTITKKLQEELAALVQHLFGSLSQFSESAKEAYGKWHMARHNYKGDWKDDAYVCALLQLYQHFGGKEKIAPALVDQFDDLVKFFDADIMSLAEVDV